MYQRDIREMIGGGLLMLFGIAAAAYAWVNYPIGTVREMGPGMFPVALGILLLILGAIILLPALLGSGAKFPTPETRPLVAISAAGLAFAFAIERFGIIPAVFIMTIIAAFGDTKLKWGGTLALAGCLSIAATLIFKTGLDLPVQAFRWPY